MKIFQQADIVPDDLSPSTWNSDPLSPVSKVSTPPSPTSVSTDDGVPTSDPTYKPNRESSTVPTPIVSEGAPHDISLEVDHPPDYTNASDLGNG